MNRRTFLTASAAFAGVVTNPDILYAAAGGGDWTLAVADIDADLPRQAMRRLHGRAPAALSGTLYRNGPAKFHRPGGSVGHWFDGDGLIRAYRVGEGEAQLTARFIDTAKRRNDTAHDAVVTPGFGTVGLKGAIVENNDSVNAANISVMPAGDGMWALWEGGSPTAFDPVTLETKGLHTFRQDLAHMPFLAHPRREPNGRVWNLGMAGDRAVVWRLSADGALEAADIVPLPRRSYVHDFTATDRHLIIVLQPWASARQVPPFNRSFEWRPETGTQILVLDKNDLTKRRVFEGPAFFFFHLGDAWEESDGTIRFDGALSKDPTFAVLGAAAIVEGRHVGGSSSADMSLVSLKPNGAVEITRSSVKGEFPRTDPRFAGGIRRRTVHLTKPSAAHPLMQAVAVTDWRREKTDSFDFGSHQIVEEMVFVPRPGGASEFDGWLMGTTINLTDRRTELHVLDAQRVAAGPLASWQAGAALPMGFHGVFVGAA